MKKLSVILLAIVMVIIAACGGGGSPAPAAPANDPPASGGAAAAPGATPQPSSGGNIKIDVFWYTFSDTYLTSVRNAMEAQLNGICRHQLHHARLRRKPSYPD